MGMKGVYIRTKPPWNKGKKTGVILLHAFKKGHTPWNLGVKKDRTKICEQCSLSFISTRNAQRFCSQKCGALHRDPVFGGVGSLGYKHSVDALKRISLAVSKRMVGKVGALNPAWKGGISSGSNKRWRAKNCKLVSFWVTQSRLLKRSRGVHSLQQWEDLKKFYNYMCLCCKQQEPFIKLTEDHVVPITQGGSNDISNIQPLCGSCNSRKYTKYIDYRLVSEQEIPT